MTERPSEESAGAESLFAAFLDGGDSGDEHAFERLCGEHPELAEELRALRARMQDVSGLFREAGIGPLPARVALPRDARARYVAGGEDESAVDAPVSPSSGPPSGELLRRLTERGGESERYAMRGEIARGGMGAVLMVWDQDLRRTLAMKVMLAREAARAGAVPPAESTKLARFLEEAQVTGQLDHPGIVPVHDLGLDPGGRLFFTMRLVRGSDLKSVFDLVSRGAQGWSETRALGVLLKVCEAMSYAHAKGVIHRDLKPANVMVGGYGEVYVMDWGLARVLGRPDRHDVRLDLAERAVTASIRTERREEREGAPDSPLVTMDGDVVGTPAYMSPEQARGEIERLGPQSDVYSIGSMLYHLLGRQMPYVKPKVRITNRTVLARLIEGPPAPLASLRPDLAGELVAIVEKAMAREPEQRYADTMALAGDLRAYLEHRVVNAYQTGALAELRKWVERNRALAMASAAGILALIAGLIVSSTLYVRAEENARLAAEQTAAAKANELLATKRAEDVLRLSAQHDLDGLIARSLDLWPPFPEKIADMETWIADARKLLADLPLHRQEKTRLRARALPRTEAERLAERAIHPATAQLERARAELGAKRSALEVRRGQREPELPDVDLGEYAKEAALLYRQTLGLVANERRTFGQEALGLRLARRAKELDPQSPDVHDALALALFAVGKGDEALDASYRALELAPPDLRERFEARYASFEELVTAAHSEEGLMRAEVEVAALEAHVAELDALVDERHDWRFAEEDRGAGRWNVQVTSLIEGLERMEAQLLSEDLVLPPHGWSVPKRLTFARSIRGRSIDGPQAAEKWAEAIEAIADPSLCPAYRGLRIEPRLGLLPIGQDPQSKLWEFAHLATGRPAQRRPDGKLALTQDTGVVLVLIPQGTFWMGAQKDDPNGRNYDPLALRDEGPVHEVAIPAHFSSKYELTQGQWKRITGANPSAYGLDGKWHEDWLVSKKEASLLLPVEGLSWLDCATWLPRVGLSLPTEAQWEYVARAGTSHPWWTGSTMEDLRGATNIADAYGYSRVNESWPQHEGWLNDGATAHAPVGSYRPNPFGLHDVHGNLFEWCLDGYDEDFYRRSTRTSPLAPYDPMANVVSRGGAFNKGAFDARSSRRFGGPPTLALNNIGVRPAMSL